MEKGYIEDGFIVDLSHAQKVSAIIYELSKILDMSEANGKQIFLKLGEIPLGVNELTSIKNLIELMEANLSCISTANQQTLESATALDIKISEFTNEINAPTFEQPEANPEVERALNNLFGGDNGSAENHSVNAESSQSDSDEVVKEAKIEDHAENIYEETADESDEFVRECLSEPETLPTLYIKRTIRSGQSISSDGNLVIIGDVNPGAEIIAKGDITVWGILGGIAHSGSEGNDYTRIRALKLNPVQIRIGTIFARRPDCVNIPYIQKNSEYTPEEAFTKNGTIIIRKIHQEN